MYRPFNVQVVVTLTNTGAVIETPMVLGYESGRLWSWTVFSSAAVVEPLMRIYTRKGQAATGLFLLPGEFTPNPTGTPQVASGFFTNPIPFKNHDSRNNDGTKVETSDVGDLYINCTSSVATVLTFYFQGEGWWPHS